MAYWRGILSGAALGKGERVRSTVRLRFRKSISGHHSQTIGKLASIDFNYHTEVVNSI